MVRMDPRRRRGALGPESSPTPLLWVSVLVFITFGALLGFPDFFKEKIPEGTKTYRIDNMTCWDKVVCCNPNDEKTCVRIPTCTID